MHVFGIFSLNNTDVLIIMPMCSDRRVQELKDMTKAEYVHPLIHPLTDDSSQFDEPEVLSTPPSLAQELFQQYSDELIEPYNSHEFIFTIAQKEQNMIDLWRTGMLEIQSNIIQQE